MKISATTKISDIIKHNKEAIEVIASINPHFKKLRNPVLRRVLAPRVNISDAARMGKCEVKDLLDALTKIGFVPVFQDQSSSSTSENISNKIDELLQTMPLKSLDVRPELEKEIDPFKLIMKTLKGTDENTILELINSFEPVPLINILKGKGYTCYVKSLPDKVITYIVKSDSQADSNPESKGQIFMVSNDELEKELANISFRIEEVDVRDMEMPLPMLTILEKLEALEQDVALYVHHKKVPEYLLPELENRGCKTWIAEIEEGNVKMLIRK